MTSPARDDAQVWTDLLEASQAASAWLYRWASHVGGCKGGGVCTCGLTAVREQQSGAIGEVQAAISDDTQPGTKPQSGEVNPPSQVES